MEASQDIVLEATGFVLFSIAKLCKFAADTIIDKNSIWEEISTSGQHQDWTKSRFTHTIYNLKKSGYLRLDSASQSVEFTNKAKLRIVDQIAKSRSKVSEYRFVSFDIPEPKRRLRDGFRRAIKKMGFVQIQKSLWVINKDVGDLVELAAYEYGVEKYMAYIASAKSDIDGIIAKKLASYTKPESVSKE
ncbi:hypothetical protein A2215_01590 [Candidatus Berkelbacteria bacterium RIFOXYA2_FULL_43_10]|uniref:Transcriptional repressor PaaX-like central Cas2-like domain-containing protein n=1 Tax=Candidatus Berkelbacteria bacterium RIFOXYA2_FULL_43_10 TaxID=1797472 RepID=A0A1F5E702_9BACT|nr:MAG: hypothetical protein A2215_01590 [Candidatus Berkelbacteria bacterium RIFOXYA2_FULL_43_10]